MNRKGFTLIELLLVLAILGIIAAIAIPALMGQADRSKVLKGAANAPTSYGGYSFPSLEGRNQQEVIQAVGYPDNKLQIDKYTESWVYTNDHIRQVVTLQNGIVIKHEVRR